MYVYACACTRIDTVKIVSIDRVLTLNVAHQTTEACLWSSSRSRGDLKLEREEVRNQYTRVVSFCSNKTIYDPYQFNNYI